MIGMSLSSIGTLYPSIASILYVLNLTVVGRDRTGNSWRSFFAERLRQKRKVQSRA